MMKDRPGIKSRESAGTATAVLALFSIAISGCHSGPRLTAQQAEGQHLYAVRCVHCHQDNDLGLKPPPPELHGVMARGILPSGAHATDAAVSKVVLDGKGNMPPFTGRFTDEQMRALIAYLKTDMPAAN